MNTKKLILLLSLAVLVTLFFLLDGTRFLSFEFVKSRLQDIQALYNGSPVTFAGVFFVFYVLVTGVSLPGAAVLTLLAGAIFGFGTALLLVSFASTIGASLAFLMSRYLFRDWISSRYGQQLAAIDRGLQTEGALYLFSLRLIPLFPFFVINLLSGLTKMKLWTFYWVSQLGMLAGTAVYINAGTQLSKLQSVAGILSLPILLSFLALGVFPLLAKKLMDRLRIYRLYKDYPRPSHFDRNLIVIGAGAGGLVSSYIAAAVKAKVTLIEKHRMGGDCLNSGCVPSKALIRAATTAHEIRQAEHYGISADINAIDFKSVMSGVQQAIKKIEPHDSVERYSGLGVDCIQGEARLTSPWSVDVNGQTLTARNIIIATGATPTVPTIPGLGDSDYLTSDTIWQLQQAPKHLLILGGGVIGCEMAQAFNRLGVPVSLVEMADHILPREDQEVSLILRRQLESEGIDIYTGTELKEVKQSGNLKTLLCRRGDEELKLDGDQVLVAFGRTANVAGFGLQELGIEINRNGTITVNDYLQTRFPNIFAVGDVAGPYQFTHVAAHQAWYASVNALFGTFKKFAADYRVIPYAVFTDPEIARVGLSETEAAAQGLVYESTRYDLQELDRAIIDRRTDGFVKILTIKGSDKILGVTITGAHAGELIAEYVLAMKHGLGMNKILSTIHTYPTMAESSKYTAGVWKNARKPQKLLKLLQGYHQWRLGDGNSA